MNSAKHMDAGIGSGSEIRGQRTMKSLCSHTTWKDRGCPIGSADEEGRSVMTDAVFSSGETGNESAWGMSSCLESS
jgi:hypothetical protein